jgi:8-oxo-dGTP pyrophosphatase MutT (NUDIX family)
VDAASVLVVRATGPLQVLMLRRASALDVAGGAWAFPGGAVELADGTGPDRFARAAARECAEETGVQVPAASLLPWARWVTPVVERRRFDARFFVAVIEVEAGTEPGAPAGVRLSGEHEDAAWWAPPAALAEQAAGRLPMLPPTLLELRRLAALAQLTAVVAEGRQRRDEGVVPLRRPVLGPDDAGHVALRLGPTTMVAVDAELSADPVEPSGGTASG